MQVAATAASAADLMAARTQMAVSLGWHIIVACLGVGFPLLVLIAEWRGLRTGDPAWRLLARRWGRTLGVLFAVGAVSGTILSFELGILWPGMMGTFGEVIGLPFAIEGVAFFTEAIFLGIYLYAWDRLPPKVHMLTAVPIVIAGVAGAFFVVAANSWMNQPRGFNLVDGKVTNVDPWAAMFNPATPPQTVHMILAAFLVSGYGVASVYAVAMLRGRRRLVAVRVTAALAVVAIIWGWAVAQYPYLLEPDLTIAQAASSPVVMQAVLVSLAVGSLLLVPSLALLFALFQREHTQELAAGHADEGLTDRDGKEAQAL
jgi:cytochrome d ubiquinol oxidase subunit I